MRIPEHLRKRAEEARRRAWRTPPDPPMIPEHLLARARVRSGMRPDLLTQQHDYAELEPDQRPSWDAYFLAIARSVAARADCRRAQHGAVIVKNHRIVATGYNGAPAGAGSCLAGDCPRGLLSAEEIAHLTPDYSNCIACHAEQNAIAYASRHDTEDATIYITGQPCDLCNKLTQAAGIERIVYP